MLILFNITFLNVRGGKGKDKDSNKKSGKIKFLDKSNNVKNDSVIVSLAWRRMYIICGGCYDVLGAMW